MATRSKKKRPVKVVSTKRPFTIPQARAVLVDLAGWRLVNRGKAITREFAVKDFFAAVDLINRIAAIAEADHHHPDLHLTGYRKLRVELTTHDVGGLSGKDFNQAGKINALSV